MTTTRPLVVATEVLLAGVTLAAVVGMSRLFDGGGWLGPLTVSAVAAHVVAAGLRRRGIPLPLAALLMALAAMLVVTWRSYWPTTTVGLPTGDTWSMMGADLGDAWSRYQDVVAPAPVEPGFVVASCLAVWVLAYVADWAAFRLWVAFEATLPASSLFLFTALLGTPRGRGWAVALFASALIAFLLVHRLARQDGSAHWVADRRAIGNRSLLVAGASLGVVAVLAGTVFGPAVPGAGSPGVLDPRSLRGDGRVTVSPLVDIRSRLVTQAGTEMFTVQSPERSYWRLTALEDFDGRIWKSSGSFGKAEGALPTAVEADVAEATFEQSFSIEALAAIWLPSAYEPRSLDAPGTEVRYDEDSATLIVDNDIDTSDGLSYRVESASPRLEPEDLTGTAAEVPDDIHGRFIELPDGFSPDVQSLAREITAEANGPAAQALALQQHLRQEPFSYSLEVQRGHSEDALEDFLFITQKGYCEQFAGAFAAMARSVGLPARVAVGFTPGDEDPDVEGQYHVRGEYAHAWPEVFIAGAGWVAYEPTPGRGAPNAEAYTGVPEEQAAAGNQLGTETPDTTATTQGLPSVTATTIDGGVPDDRRDASTGGTGRQGGGAASLFTRYVDPVVTAAAIVLGLVLAYVILFPLGLLLWRLRRRRRATTPGDRIELAWVSSAEHASLVGYAERASDTYVEGAQRLAAALGDGDDPALRLARCREAAAYSPTGADEDDAARAQEAADELTALARGQQSLLTRVHRWLDPRSLVRTWRQGHTARQRRITLTARGDLEQERELVGSRDRG